MEGFEAIESRSCLGEDDLSSFYDKATICNRNKNRQTVGVDRKDYELFPYTRYVGISIYFASFERKLKFEKNENKDFVCGGKENVKVRFAVV